MPSAAAPNHKKPLWSRRAGRPRVRARPPARSCAGALFHAGYLALPFFLGAALQAGHLLLFVVFFRDTEAAQAPGRSGAGPKPWGVTGLPPSAAQAKALAHPRQ